MRARLRVFWARLQARPDTEHEQAFIRLAVGSVLFFYLLPGAFIHAGAERTADVAYLAAMAAFLAAAAGLIVSIVVHPGISRVRRFLGMAMDAGATSFFMIAADVRALPLFLIYVWITLANGFRYGASYLLASLGISVAGFTLVLAFNPFWHARLEVGLGLLVGLSVLAVYVLSLVRRMAAAVERAEAANEAKRRFISVVSHEMRTPLNAIINMAELLHDTPLGREQVDMVQTLSGSSRVLLGLVEDVLDFSKIEAGKLNLETIDFDLPALVNATAKILAPQADAKGLDLSVIVMPDVPPALQGDPHHLRQVLINLVGNAIKFTERGSVTLHVSLLEETDSAVKIKVSVRDTGIGIHPSAQKRIFDSFGQADESTTRRFGGTGLGTTIAKQLVELMGGRVGLESAVGLGSTFWFEIQLGKQPEVAQDATELGDARVLVLGFDEEEQRSVVAMLSGWGAKPMVHEAVEQAAQQVLREISIAPAPRMAIIHAKNAADGQSLLAQLRRAVRLTRLPAVIAMPREALVPGVTNVAGGRNLVLELPLGKRDLFNALHAVAEEEPERNDVVMLSDYLKKRDTPVTLKVLVADDNASNRTVISKILERAGHAAELVASGEQVLDSLERARYDVVILDRNMPDMGGVETLKRLRFMTAGPDRVPVIVVSADATPEARQECVDAGADAFLAKPIQAPRLLDLIAELGAQCKTRAAEPPRPSAPRQGEAPAVLNRETLRLLEELGTDSDFMERLVTAFISDVRGFLQRLDRDDKSMSIEEFRSILHALKGSVSSIGADRLTHFCVRVGAMDDEVLQAESNAVTEALRDEFETVRNGLADYLASRRRTSG